MNQKGIVLSSLVYALFTFFLLLLVSFLVVLWYRQNAINSLADDANNIYDEPYVPDTEYQEDFVIQVIIKYLPYQLQVNIK
jgi:hypothetical protein